MSYSQCTTFGTKAAWVIGYAVTTVVFMGVVLSLWIGAFWIIHKWCHSIGGGR